MNPKAVLWRPAPYLVLAASLAILAACRDKPPPITVPDNRIQYFLGHESHKMTSQQKYHEFIVRELGRDFTEVDFILYMQGNEAECERDTANGIMYCLYVDFKIIPRPDNLWKTMNAVRYFCFWALPPAERPMVRFHQAGASSTGELPMSRNEFAYAHKIPGCRELLLREHGVEK